MSIVNQQMIAEHLNISVATVSKALRNQPGVSEALRERVAQAARDLGYQRVRSRTTSSSARRSLMLAALIRQPLTHGNSRLPEYIDGLCESSSRLNASVLIQTYGYKSCVENIATDPSLQPPAMREGKVHGLLLGGEWPAHVVTELARNYPCVCFPNDVEADVDQIGLNTARTSLQIMRHLTSLGHQRIGFLGRCDFAWAGERFAGYVAALSRVGLTYDSDCVIDIDREPMLSVGNESYWRQIVDRVDACRRAGVSAWMCSSDWPGYQLFRGMLDRGVRVPQDISIFGFDDSELVNLGCPPLTSVRIPREVMGRAALRRLISRIDHPDLPVQQTLFTGKLMINGTTGPAQGAAEHIEQPHRRHNGEDDSPQVAMKETW